MRVRFDTIEKTITTPFCIRKNPNKQNPLLMVLKCLPSLWVTNFLSECNVQDLVGDPKCPPPRLLLTSRRKITIYGSEFGVVNWGEAVWCRVHNWKTQTNRGKISISTFENKAGRKDFRRKTHWKWELWCSPACTHIIGDYCHWVCARCKRRTVAIVQRSDGSLSDDDWELRWQF